MIGKHKSASALIKQRSPDCNFFHCILHCKALVSRKLKTISSDKVSKLEKLMSDVTKILNAIRPKVKTSRLFSKLCDAMSTDCETLLVHSEVRWLSQGKV